LNRSTRKYSIQCTTPCLQCSNKLFLSGSTTTTRVHTSIFKPSTISADDNPANGRSTSV